MKKNKNKKNKNGINSKIIMGLYGLLAGPIEILVLQLLSINSNSTSLLAVIGILLAFVIAFRIIQFIIANILFRKESFSKLDEAIGLSCLCGGISFAITYFILFRVAGEGNGTAIILTIVAMAIQSMFLIPGGGSFSDENKEVKMKNSGSGIRIAHFKDANGNYNGSATTYNFGDVEYTEFKNKNGKTTGEGTRVGNYSEYKKR